MKSGKGDYVMSLEQIQSVINLIDEKVDRYLLLAYKKRDREDIVNISYTFKNDGYITLKLTSLEYCSYDTWEDSFPVEFLLDEEDFDKKVKSFLKDRIGK